MNFILIIIRVRVIITTQVKQHVNFQVRYIVAVDDNQWNCHSLTITSNLTCNDYLIISQNWGFPQCKNLWYFFSVLLAHAGV